MKDFELTRLSVLTREFKSWMYFYHDFTPSDILKMDYFTFSYYVDLFEVHSKKSAFIKA